jgi:hypothetical protein
MKKLLLFLGLFLVAFATIAQEKDYPEPTEIYVIGKLKMHNIGSDLFASIYDKRTDIIYQFQLPNGDECGALINDYQYVFRLLATCNSTDCYEANYTMVAYSPTLKQTYRIVERITSNAPIRFRLNIPPTKYK